MARRVLCDARSCSGGAPCATSPWVTGLDGFEITDVIARGAMGSVFKAVDVASGQAVALKVPHVQYESDVVFFERIRREEQIGREVDHPNVVRTRRLIREAAVAECTDSLFCVQRNASAMRAIGGYGPQPSQ